MSIIAISYGSSATRDNIAMKVAEAVGYEPVGREVILSASKKFQIPEAKLAQVIRDVPSFFAMSASKRKRYTAYILAAAAQYLKKDNIVYHGPAAHLIGKGISHVLKVRIISPLEVRIAFAMERNKISRDEAREIVARDERERKKWSKLAFGLDDSRSDLYDLVVDMNQTDSEEAIHLIAAAARDKKYQPMTYSLQCASNVELSYRVKAHLIDIDPDINVRCENGNVYVNTKGLGRAKDKKFTIIQERVSQLPDVRSLEIQLKDDLFERIAGTMR